MQAATQSAGYPAGAICLAQVHFETWTGGGTTNPLISKRPALPPGPQLPVGSNKNKYKNICVYFKMVLKWIHVYVRIFCLDNSVSLDK